MAPINKRLLLQINLVCMIALLRHRRIKVKKEKRKHKLWVRQFFLQRQEQGQFHTLFQELKLHDREYFFRFVKVNYSSSCNETIFQIILRIKHTTLNHDTRLSCSFIVHSLFSNSKTMLGYESKGENNIENSPFKYNVGLLLFPQNPGDPQLGS